MVKAPSLYLGESWFESKGADRSLRNVARGAGRNDDALTGQALFFPLLWRDAVREQDFFKLGAFYRLFFYQLFRDSVEGLAVFADDLFRARFRLINDACHLGIYLSRDLLGVWLATELALAESDWSQFFAHPVAHDHIARKRGDDHEVIGGPRRHVIKEHFLSDIAAECCGDVIEKLFLRMHLLVFKRKFQRIAGRAPAADDGNLVHRVRVWQYRGYERVAGFVVGGELFFFL